MTKFLRLFVLTCIVLFSVGQAQQTSKADQPSIKQMTLPAVTLTYQEQGQGDTVIFVHGSFSDHRVWEAQREAVAKGYRFIAVDLRYHGNSPWPDNTSEYVAANSSNYALATFSNDLATLIRQLNVGPVHVVGWSYGGNIALNLAAQSPELVRSLVLYEPALSTIVSDPADLETLGKEGEGINPAFAASQEGDQTEAVRLFAEWVNAQPGGIDDLEPGLRTVFLENARTLALNFTTPFDPPIICTQLGQIDVPVTVMKGQQTRPIFDIVADTTHDCIPDSKLVTIPDTRHLGPAENPTAFNEALLSHLESVETKE